MSKKKISLIRSSAAEYLTFVAATGEQSESDFDRMVKRLDSKGEQE
jgi:hypothetical protein